MARPEKIRVVSKLPQFTKFICEDSEVTHTGSILLSVEEYEVIRWLDYHGRNQQECAEVMQISRGTVQALYTEARKKIARHFIEGMSLEV